MDTIDSVGSGLALVRGRARAGERRPGGRRVLVGDPSGNPVELFEAAAAG